MADIAPAERKEAFSFFLKSQRRKRGFSGAPASSMLQVLMEVALKSDVQHTWQRQSEGGQGQDNSPSASALHVLVAFAMVFELVQNIAVASAKLLQL